ncbi:MAG: tetratricopeptide repeat-containing sulfotransferase family protein [Hyphomicrobiales bacterium]
MTTKTESENQDELLSEAAAYLEEKRYLKARKLCDRVLARDPNNASAHMIIAGILEGRDDIKGAIERYRQATDCDPNHFASWVNMGVCLKQAGMADKAVDAFETALRLDPDSTIVLYNLAHCLFEGGRMADAIDRFKSVLKQRPGWAEVHFTLGLAYQRLNRQEDALDQHRRAVDLKPDYPAAHTELARGLQALGKFEDARTHLQTALRDRPDYGRAHYLLAAMHPAHQAAQDEQGVLERHLGTGQLPAHTRMNMHFAAACLYDQTEDYEPAFEHCRTANDLFKREFGTSTDRVAQNFDRIKKVFSQDHFGKRADCATVTPKPVLVAGLARSGLSLVEQIISAHPQAAAGGELTGVLDAERHGANGTGGRKNIQDLMATLPDDELAQLARRYLAALPARTQDAARVTDRVSFIHGRLGFIATLFPGAKVILCRRDPMDLCWSSYFNYMPERLGYTCDLQDLAAMSTHHKTLMDHWAAVLPNPVLEVQYETLVTDPEREIRRIIAFLDLDWDDDCLDFPEKAGIAVGPSFWQVRQPIFETSIGKWRRYEQHLGALKSALGARGSE